jgi:hypothetical protein
MLPYVPDSNSATIIENRCPPMKTSFGMFFIRWYRLYGVVH